MDGGKQMSQRERRKRTYICLGITLIIIIAIIIYCNRNGKVQAEEQELIINLEDVKIYYDVPLDFEVQDYLFEQCEKYDVPAELVLAVISKESNFKANAISKTNDYGLMQINKVNHKWLKKQLGVTDFLDAKQNILCGVYILSGNLKSVDGNIHKALMQYQFGIAGAKRLWRKNIYSSKHSRSVVKLYEQYKGNGND